MTYGSFGTTHISLAEHRDIYSINLQDSQGNATLLATAIPNICTPLTRHLVPPDILKSFGNDIEFVDAPVGKDVRVDILID